MKRSLVVLLITLALSFAVTGQEHGKPPRTTPPSTPPITPAVPTNVPDTGGWVRFTSQAGRFTVLMPDIPTEKPETVQTAHGPYTTHLFVVRDSKSVFLIGWVDYDPSFNFSPTHELEANRDNFIKGINARLVTTRPTTVDGYQAIEFTAETEDRIFKSRVFMVGRRPYQIVIGSPKVEDDTISANRFFNSFKVRLY